uniref:Uncharacterized protein n=1 Tax=Tetranychus urticae TaxID=32264 RepID=T1K4W6_TETUR
MLQLCPDSFSGLRVVSARKVNSSDVVECRVEQKVNLDDSQILGNSGHSGHQADHNAYIISKVPQYRIGLFPVHSLALNYVY